MKFKVILSHIFLKSNLKLVTVNRVPREPHHADGVVEFWADICSLFPIPVGPPSGLVEKSRALRGGHVNWWPLRRAFPWLPPCSETPLKWKKVSKCKFPENSFSVEQHFQTTYLPFIFGLSLSLSLSLTHTSYM